MVAPKDKDRVPVLSGNTRRSDRLELPERLRKVAKRPKQIDLPGIVVRARNGSEPSTLMNLTHSRLGADLVLFMIDAYPEAALLTQDLTYLQMADITRVDCPERGEILIEPGRRGHGLPFRFIQVRESLTVDPKATVGIRNIPDSPLGRDLLAEIFASYASTASPLMRQRSSDLYEYQLYTTEGGYVPVRSLAEANREFR